MPCQDLRDFIRLLEDRGELCRVKVEVDPVLEISAITDRVCKVSGGGKALFFEKVRGHAFPVLTNLFGSFRRTAWALGVEDVEVLAERLAQGLRRTMGRTSEEKLRSLVEEKDYLPQICNQAPCQEVIIREETDLSIIPALKSWAGDEGRFITLPMVFTRDPVNGRKNCGMYRIQIFDRKTTGIHWGRLADGARHYRLYLARGERMPVAIAIGGDPAFIYSATAPLPSGVEEGAFAGFLRQRPMEMVRCVCCDIEVPASAEFIIEGYIDPGEMGQEGPFGNHTGYYTAVEPCPVFHVTAITHRKDALYPCTVVGRPPMENCYLAKATERLFIPQLRLDLPEIVELNLPLETIFHNCALVSIRKGYPGHGKKVIRDLWDNDRMKSAKLLVVLDHDVDVKDLSSAFWRAVNHVDVTRDVIIDGNRVGIDATRKGSAKMVEMDVETDKLVKERWSEYGIEL